MRCEQDGEQAVLGKSWRSSRTPFNRCPSVCMTSGRVALLIYLIVSMEGTFLLENPASSCILLHPHLQHLFFRSLRQWGVPAPLVARVARFPSQVWRTTFWMRKFGAPTPKRTMIISNSSRVGQLDLGPLSKQEKIVGKEFKTCRRYVDRKGPVRYCETKALKQTQCLGRMVPVSLHGMVTLLCYLFELSLVISSL